MHWRNKMALQTDRTLDSGIDVIGCYARIRSVELRRSNSNIDIAQIIVDFFKDATAYSEGKPSIKTESYETTFDDTTTLPISDWYTYLKTLPAFTGATDV